MTRLRLLACAALALPYLAQNTLARILSFEVEHNGGFPNGWGGISRKTISLEDKVVHGGRWSVRLERHKGAKAGFSTITKSLPVDFTGRRCSSVKSTARHWVGRTPCPRPTPPSSCRVREIRTLS
jgi:hypothetical protein